MGRAGRRRWPGGRPGPRAERRRSRRANSAGRRGRPTRRRLPPGGDEVAEAVDRPLDLVLGERRDHHPLRAEAAATSRATSKPTMPAPPRTRKVRSATLPPDSACGLRSSRASGRAPGQSVPASGWVLRGRPPGEAGRPCPPGPLRHPVTGSGPRYGGACMDEPAHGMPAPGRRGGGPGALDAGISARLRLPGHPVHRDPRVPDPAGPRGR